MRTIKSDLFGMLPRLGFIPRLANGCLALFHIVRPGRPIDRRDIQHRVTVGRMIEAHVARWLRENELDKAVAARRGDVTFDEMMEAAIELPNAGYLKITGNRRGFTGIDSHAAGIAERSYSPIALRSREFGARNFVQTCSISGASEGRAR